MIPLIKPENLIWALTGLRKSKCYGKGFSPGALVAHFEVCSLVSRQTTANLLVVIVTSQRVTISHNCLGLHIHSTVSRGQHSIGIIGQKTPPMSFCHDWAELPLSNETSQVKIIQTVWLCLYKVTQQRGNSFQCRSMKRKALPPCRNCHAPCKRRWWRESAEGHGHLWLSPKSITTRLVPTKFSSSSY